MRRKALRLMMLVTALIVISGTVFAVSAASKGKGKPKSFKIFATTEFNKLVDLGPSGLSEADHLIIKKRMALQKRPDKEIGEDWISCLVTAVEGDKKVATSCDVNYWFPELGQITASGFVRLDLAAHLTFDIAVTGGTGKFKDASGFVRIKQTSGAHELTFYLDRPIPKALR